MRSRTAAVLALVLVLVCALLASCGEDTGGEEPEMTLFVYIIGSNLESRSGCASRDLAEMIAAKPGKHVRVIVETGGAYAWQNYGISNRTLQRYEVTGKGVRLIEELESARMSDAETLSGFLKWGKENYPSRRSGVILWNHGGGSVMGYGSDELYPQGMLPLSGIQAAFADAGERFDFVGFDACLMATVETASVLSGYADYLIASEETEPGDGWAYTDWIRALERHPNLTTEELGEEIAESFFAQAQAKPDYAYTLSVIRLQELPSLLEALSAYWASSNGRLYQGGYLDMASARIAAKSFGGGRYEQVDIGDYVRRSGQEGAEALSAALASCVACHKSNVAGTCGLAMYFPYESIGYYSRMLRELRNAGYSESYFEFFDSFCSVLSITEEDAAAASSGEEGSKGDFQAWNLGRKSALRSHGDLPSSDYEGESWYRKEIVDLYYPEAKLTSREVAVAPSPLMELSLYDGTYTVTLPEGVAWEDLWYEEKRMLLDDGEKLWNLGSAGRQLFEGSVSKLAGDTSDGTLLWLPSWVCIEGVIVPYFFQSFEERTDGMLNEWGCVPALLNGTDSIQLVVYDGMGTGHSRIVGYLDDETAVRFNGMLLPEKGFLQLSPGDTLQFPADTYDYDYQYLGTELLEGLVTVGEGDLSVRSDAYIGNAAGRISAAYWDYYNNYLYTPWVAYAPRDFEAELSEALRQGAWPRKGTGSYDWLEWKDFANVDSENWPEDWIWKACPANDPDNVGIFLSGRMDFGFPIRNESPYEIASIYLERAHYPQRIVTVDLLYETLPPGKTAVYADAWFYNDWNTSMWTLYLTDTEGRTSVGYEMFNPWVVQEITVRYDAERQGYTCDFTYPAEAVSPGDSPVAEEALSRFPAWDFLCEHRGERAIVHLWMAPDFSQTPEKMAEVYSRKDASDLRIGRIPAGETTPYHADMILNTATDIWALYIVDGDGLAPESAPILPYPVWTLEVGDVDGNRSAAPQTFRPWELKKLTINWDEEQGGYVCEFAY